MSTDSIAVPDSKASIQPITLVGLAISLFGMVAIAQVIRFYWPEPTVTSSIVREGLFWLLGVALIWIVRSGEGVTLRTIGIGTAKMWQSFAWGPALAAVSLFAAVMLAHVTGYGHGKNSQAFDRLPLWLVTCTVFRAGILEELFFRGYAIERLKALGLQRWTAAGIPLVIFAIGHFRGGWANIAIAFVIGAILTVFYLWKKDLVANMVAHTLVDLIGNVIPRLLK
jgi:CAAX protease family protein